MVAKKDEKIPKDQPEQVGGFSVEQPSEVRREVPKETLEDAELTEGQHQALKDQIEKMDIDDGLKTQAQSDASGIKALDEKKKIQQLLVLAKTKGVLYAVNVAKNMNDPYLLDTLHDILVKGGHYKDFLT